MAHFTSTSQKALCNVLGAVAYGQAMPWILKLKIRILGIPAQPLKFNGGKAEAKRDGEDES
jgi:hypothetical protein